RSADAERRITQRSVQPAGSEHRHVGKGVALLLPCEEISVYRPPGFQRNIGNARYRFVQENEPLRIGVRQSAQQYRVDETEYRRRSANAQSQGQNCQT